MLRAREVHAQNALTAQEAEADHGHSRQRQRVREAPCGRFRAQTGPHPLVLCPTDNDKRLYGTSPTNQQNGERGAAGMPDLALPGWTVATRLAHCRACPCPAPHVRLVASRSLTARDPMLRTHRARDANPRYTQAAAQAFAVQPRVAITSR